MHSRLSTATRRAVVALRRLTAAAIAVAAVYLAFHLYIFGGDPMISAILVIVASAALPLGKNTVRRTKELQLRRALASMRSAIDQYAP